MLPPCGHNPVYVLTARDGVSAHKREWALTKPTRLGFLLLHFAHSGRKSKARGVQRPFKDTR